uniref:rho GTPase-activating protein 19 isoform X2 n=1 Tax=Myxine glutinosa TaxID=7769 RepID=UPI00358E88DE
MAVANGCSIVTSNLPDLLRGQPVVSNPEFFVEKLRHELPEFFEELVMSNISRLIDLPGEEFSEILPSLGVKSSPSSSGFSTVAAAAAHTSFFRGRNFLRKKERRSGLFGALLTKEGIAQVHQLIQYLHDNLHVKGIFRIAGNCQRQQALREAVTTGSPIDFKAGDYNPHDAAAVLKAFLAELPEPLLTDRHYNAHLKIADLMQVDANQRAVPDKEKRIETLQLLLLLLPQENRDLLHLLLNLLYQAARQQERNEMSAFNLALMVTPHLLWPRNTMAGDFHANIGKMNSAVSFMIKHTQRIFKSPAYICEQAKAYFPGAVLLDEVAQSAVQSQQPLQHHAQPCSINEDDVQQRTDRAVQDLFQHVQHMSDSVKKKKILKKFSKYHASTPNGEVHTRKSRSRSFSGLIRRRVLGNRNVADISNERNSVDMGSNTSLFSPTTINKELFASSKDLCADPDHPRRRSRSSDSIRNPQRRSSEYLCPIEAALN